MDDLTSEQLTEEELLLLNDESVYEGKDYQKCDCESELQTVIDSNFRANESELRKIMKEV